MPHKQQRYSGEYGDAKKAFAVPEKFTIHRQRYNPCADAAKSIGDAKNQPAPLLWNVGGKSCEIAGRQPANHQIQQRSSSYNNTCIRRKHSYTGADNHNNTAEGNARPPAIAGYFTHKVQKARCDRLAYIVNSAGFSHRPSARKLHKAISLHDICCTAPQKQYLSRCD